MEAVYFSIVLYWGKLSQMWTTPWCQRKYKKGSWERSHHCHPLMVWGNTESQNILKREVLECITSNSWGRVESSILRVGHAMSLGSTGVTRDDLLMNNNQWKSKRIAFEISQFFKSSFGIVHRINGKKLKWNFDFWILYTRYMYVKSLTKEFV